MDVAQAIFFGVTIGERLVVGVFAVFCIGLPFSLPFLGLAFWFRSRHKKADQIHQLMSDTETTPIGSLKPGPVEIRGRVKSTLPPAPSPWHQKPCVFYHFLVQQYHSSESAGGWVDCIDDRSKDPFTIKDDTGSVEIIPGEGRSRINADFATTTGFSNEVTEDLRSLLNTRYGKDTKGLIFQKELRYNESILENGDEVYVFGEARQGQGKYAIGAGQMPLIISENGESGVEEEYASTARRYKLLYCGMLGAAGFFAVVIFCISLFADVSG